MNPEDTNNSSTDTSTTTDTTNTTNTSTNSDNDDTVFTNFVQSQVFIYGSDDHYMSSQPYDKISGAISVSSLNSTLSSASVDLLQYYGGVGKDILIDIKPDSVSLVGSYLYLRTSVDSHEQLNSNIESSIETFLTNQYRDGWGTNVFRGVISTNNISYRLSLWDPLITFSWISK